MAPDPFSSLILFVLFMFAGAYLRAAEAAARLVDETALEKDSPAARFVSACDNRFGAPSATFGLLMLAACACAFCAFFEPLALWLEGALHAPFFAALLAAAALWLVTAVLYTAVCALLPAYVAAHAPEKTLARTLGLANLLLSLAKPFLLCAKGLATLILKPFHVPVTALGERVTKQEIRMMVDIGEEKGEIEADEKQMIENVFEFNNMTAEECMVHRKDVTAIDVEDDPATILQTIQDSGLSRFPVYEEDVDNILGILTSRDYLLNDCYKRGRTLRELIRPAYFVPESLRADLLFSEMQKRKQHMAIVVDEYGGTSGLVTMEDLLEEIVGNIYDETDPLEAREITELEPGVFRVAGHCDLDVLRERLGVDIPENDEIDTLSGLIINELSNVPEDGSTFDIDLCGMHVHVDEVRDRRVEWTTVRLPAKDEAAEEASPAAKED